MYVLSFVWMLSDVIKGREYELVFNKVCVVG